MNTIKTGRLVLIISLVGQVITFSIFVFYAITFDIRSRRALGEHRKPIQPLFWAFYASAVLIIGRSVYRTIGECFSSAGWELADVGRVRDRVCVDQV